MSDKDNFSQKIELEGRQIGPGKPVFIIAEIGLNHNGDLNLAKRTIEAAAIAGVDCVKFQTFQAEEFMADRELVYKYNSGGIVVKENMFDMFKRLELPFAWHQDLFDHARSLGLVPLTSVADAICADMALEAGANALKLASEDLINLPLLEKVAGAGVPLILSTGMADEAEIADAVKVMKEAGCKDVLFLHCVSLYPTSNNLANLNRMKTLARITNASVGYSDHTTGVEACLAAVAMGAVVLEKHFTLNKSFQGPDHNLSADSDELARIVEGVRRIGDMLGSGDIKPNPAEEAFRFSFRRSIVSARNVPAGTILTRNDLTLKRPGNGMHPRQIERLIGKQLIFNVAANTQLNDDMLL